MSDGVWMSVSEAALARGVSKQAISKRLASLSSAGKVATRREGPKLMLNIVEYDRVTGAETDPAQSLRNIAMAPAPAAAPASAPGNDGLALKVYSTNKAKISNYQAENARLDFEERLKKLTQVDEVERRQMDIFRRVRDRLLGLPGLTAERMHAAPDARAARAILNEAVRDMIDKLAAELDHLDRAESLDAAV